MASVPSLVEPIPPVRQFDEQFIAWLTDQFEEIRVELNAIDARLVALEP